jgi:hypothetical protein
VEVTGENHNINVVRNFFERMAKILKYKTEVATKKKLTL